MNFVEDAFLCFKTEGVTDSVVGQLENGGVLVEKTGYLLMQHIW